MARRILSGALIAGLAAGLVAAALSLMLLVPLILEAETYEAAAAQAPAAPAGAGQDEAAPVGAAGGAARHLGTVAFTVVAYAGFGLLLGAGMALAARRGHRIDARAGLLWGFGGFAAFHLAPAMGLPPELPGADAAALGARQAWWALCAGSTALGFAALAFGRSAPALAAGAALVALPQLVGAPAGADGGLVPPGLAAEFVARSLAVAGVAWATLGTLAGALAAPRRLAAA